MSAISPERRAADRQPRLFYPAASRWGRRYRLLGLSLLFLPLLLWPSTLSLPWHLLQILLMTGLLLALWRARRLSPCRPFSLDESGVGHWLDDGAPFRVTVRSRLLPGMVMMAVVSGGRAGWLWQHEDSFGRADWRRLCRMLLVIQRGERMVGPDSGSVSG